MLFGTTETFGIECEIDDTENPCFWGKVRIWIGGHPYGDFACEIISVYVHTFERIRSQTEVGTTDCTGLLPYVGALSWLIATTEEAHVICAYTEQAGIYSVVMPKPQLFNVIDQFTRWVRFHDNFILNNLPA